MNATGKKTPTKKDLQLQLAQLQQAYSSQAVDVSRLRSQSRRQLDQALRQSQQKLLLSLLPVIDNLQRAFEQSPDPRIADDQWVRGVLMIQKSLDDQLHQIGLERIRTVGCQFDPDTMEALAVVANDQVPAQTVVREVLAGYRYNQTILRVAQVQVAGPAVEPSAKKARPGS